MKNILTIAAALFTCAASFSQEEPANDNKTLSIGPAIGFGHTGIRNATGTAMFKPFYSAGIILNYSSSEHIGFAADVLWSREGSLVESNDVETDLTLQYVRVPLKFAYYFGEFENDFRPKLTIGPSLGFMFDAESEAEDGKITDVTSAYEMFDIGVNASAGFNWKLANNVWLNTDLNYYNGFRSIRSDLYNWNLGLRVGLAFGL